MTPPEGLSGIIPVELLLQMHSIITWSHLIGATEKQHLGEVVEGSDLKRVSSRRPVASEMIEMSERSPLCRNFSHPYLSLNFPPVQ